MDNKVITISREFGSGGRTIGRMLSERLGYAFFDKELIRRIAAKSGYSEEFIEARGEDANTTNSFLFNLARSGGRGYDNIPSVSDKLFITQHNIIKALPDEGPCVIVGRCADYILRDNPDALHVYVYADVDFKTKRIVELYGETNDNPRKRLEEKDKKRIIYYNNYTGRRWGEFSNYDISLNSGKLGIDNCVNIIAGLIEN